jgi:hypothetical protein
LTNDAYRFAIASSRYAVATGSPVTVEFTRCNIVFSLTGPLRVLAVSRGRCVFGTAQQPERSRRRSG